VAEFAFYQRPTTHGYWVAALEKAYGTDCMNNDLYRAFRRIRGYANSVMPQEHTDGGSLLEAGLQYMTGRDIGYVWGARNNTDEEVRAAGNRFHDALAAGSRDHRAMTIGTISSVRGGPETFHQYSIVSYDADNRTVVLRNPWGRTPPTCEGVTALQDGKFSMSVDLCARLFTRLAYEEPERR
jgi:hypothetical protein